MKEVHLCKPYAWESPSVLLETGLMWKRAADGPCVSEIVNQIVLVLVLSFLAGAVVQSVLNQPMAMSIFLGLGALYVLAPLWTIFQIRAATGAGAAAAAPAKAKTAAAEGFQDSEKGGRAYEVYDVIGKGGVGAAAPATLTLPTARNPFMNVLIDEIKYAPKRAMAASIYDPSVKVSLDDFFRTEFYSDPTDVFGRTQGQRQFITMPSTSIPNDQDSYQNWLYRIPGKTCKEGGREACMPGTDGGAIPWLNVSP